MPFYIFAVTQQIAMEYAGKRLFWSKGTCKCHWNLPTPVINQYFKQRAVTALKPGRIPLHMQEKCTKLVQGHRWLTCHPFHNCMYYIRKHIYIYNSCILSAYAAWMCWHSKWPWYLQKKCIAFITRNPLDISACLKLPFLLYIHRTLVEMRLHTGWNHSPTKA